MKQQNCRKYRHRAGTYADANEEFVEVDETISISIEKAHKLVSLITRDADLDFAEATVELLGVNLVVAVERIEVSEGPAETSDSFGTTCLDLSSYSVENYIDSNIERLFLSF